MSQVHAFTLMLSRGRLAVAVALAVAAVAAVLTVPATDASAAGTCAEHGAVPARVVLARASVRLTMVLAGTAGCRQGHDYGATAQLVPPSGRSDPLRWAHLGNAQRVVLRVGMDPTGRYAIRRGNVQTYDRREERVPSRWVVTGAVVKRGGRFAALRSSADTVRARLQQFTEFGWAPHRGVQVWLQHRPGTTGRWHSVASDVSGRGGAVAFAVRRAGGQWRLASASTRRVWNAARRLAG